MPTNNRKQNLADIVPDSNVGGEGLQPNANEGGSAPASPEALAMALDESQKRVAQLEAQLAARPSGDNSVEALAKVLAAYIPKPQAPAAPKEADNLNRTTDFSTAKTTVDGRSLVEAQQTLRVFREEEKRPISIPKSTANFVGGSLDVTVNGVRVSIPCDGHTYMINKTHWLHARERLAKLDLLNGNTTPQIVELGD